MAVLILVASLIAWAANDKASDPKEKAQTYANEPRDWSAISPTDMSGGGRR